MRRGQSPEAAVPGQRRLAGAEPEERDRKRRERSQEGDVRPIKSSSWFTHFAKATARITGRPATFAVAVGVILAWAITGPFFRFSDTWQLVINTSTTIVTFLMVFLIQNTQNRDSEAIQVKLDELIRAIDGAHNALLDLEEMEETDLDRIRADYERLAERARTGLRLGQRDTDTAELVEGETG
jgi:low affinity Fe/Cu permease